MLDKSNSEKEGLIRLRFEGTVCHGREVVVVGAEGSCSHHICSQEADRRCWYSACSLLFIQSGSPLHSMVLPTFSHHIEPNAEIPSQACPEVTVDPVKLTINISYHTEPFSRLLMNNAACRRNPRQQLDWQNTVSHYLNL